MSGCNTSKSSTGMYVRMMLRIDGAELHSLFHTGPMSVSIFVRKEIIDKYRQILVKTFVNRTNIAIHLIVNNKVRDVINVFCDNNLYRFIIIIYHFK